MRQIARHGRPHESLHPGSLKKAVFRRGQPGRYVYDNVGEGEESQIPTGAKRENGNLLDRALRAIRAIRAIKTGTPPKTQRRGHDFKMACT